MIRSIKSYKAVQKFVESLSLNTPQNKTVNESDGGKRRILIKSIAAFVLWFIFSLYIFTLDLVSSVGDKVGEETLVAADSRTLGIIGAHILWLLAGMLLIYWLGRIPKAAKLS
ncbi:MAG: hypothetical protein ACR2LT_00280 [Pyrinomonadaceae bacterium]